MTEFVTPQAEVTVCAACLTASCWRGMFMCDEAFYADVRTMTVAELDRLGREHPSNYRQVETDAAA